MDLLLQQVSHKFGSAQPWVLSEISLDIASGTFVCVVGPTSSGKSTLLSLFGGQLTPAAGVVTRTAPSALGNNSARIGHLFQDPCLLPRTSLAENLRLVAPAEKQDAVEATLGELGLGAMADRRPDTLSLLDQQRASLARAMIVQPGLLLMDESLASLDEAGRSALMADIVTLWQRYRFTVIYVTHSLREATLLGQKVVVLSPRPGRVLRVAQIDIPISERSQTHRPLIALQRSLWESYSSGRAGTA